MRELFVYHLVVVGAQVLVPFGELPCAAGHLKTVAHLPEAIPDRLVVIWTQTFAANRDEGTAMHEEDADEIPVPWLGAQCAVTLAVGLNAFEVSMQPHKPLHLVATVSLMGKEGQLVGCSRPACAVQWVVADAGGVYE